MGADTGLTIEVGQRVTVRLSEAAPVTGGLALELVSLEGKSLPEGPARGKARPPRGTAKGKPPKRKLARAKKQDEKTRRKVKRSRR
mgnify:CR=1 FL=1